MIMMDHIPSNPEEIYLIVEAHKTESDRLIGLEGQFKGEQNILYQASPADSSKPDNRLVNNYPGYITLVNCGYFIGKPVRYMSNSQNDAMMEELQGILNYNDEQDENMSLAKTASVKGVACEMLYIDGDAMVRFNEVEPESVILVYDKTIERNLLFAIRYWGDEETITAELYDRSTIKVYLLDVKSKKGGLVEERQHFFDDVPLVPFYNNDEAQGDFEKVMSLIDAYDQAQSETANDFAYFTDAYLVIRNMSGTSAEDIQEAKRNRVLLLDNEGQVEWLTKTIQDTALENYKNRLMEDIHKFSMTPNLTDESFAGNVSGVALEFKLWGLEQAAAQKERKFKRALQRRIELIFNALRYKGRVYDWRDVGIMFTRNIPMNLPDIVEMVKGMKGIISDITLLSQLPFIEDPKEELERMQNDYTVDLTPVEEEPDA